MSAAGLDNDDILSARLLNEFQRDLPLEAQPFAAIARRLGSDEATVIDLLGQLLDDGVISRVGPVIRPHTIGASVLAAIAVPPDRLAQVAELISEQPEVNHNYEREHHFNLWFVLTAADEAALADAVERLEQAIALEIMTLPMLDDYFIDLGFDLETGDDRFPG